MSAIALSRAERAAATRKRRRDYSLMSIASMILDGRHVPPSSRCYICGRRIADAESRSRGVGVGCWSEVLDAVEALRAADEG